ncbi:unnamed protein product [Discula destructiva]
MRPLTPQNEPFVADEDPAVDDGAVCVLGDQGVVDTVWDEGLSAEELESGSTDGELLRLDVESAVLEAEEDSSPSPAGEGVATTVAEVEGESGGELAASESAIPVVETTAGPTEEVDGSKVPFTPSTKLVGAGICVPPASLSQQMPGPAPVELPSPTYVKPAHPDAASLLQTSMQSWYEYVACSEA